MKYIRTKDGIYKYADYLGIHDGKRYALMDDAQGNRITMCQEPEELYKTADTIEDLIMPGDLVRYDVLYMSWIEKDRGDEVRGIDMHLIPRKSVNMLWIPTGNDTECYPNFKLVASKEDDKGELELI